MAVNELYLFLLLDWLLTVSYFAYSLGHLVQIDHVKEYLTSKVQKSWLAAAYIDPKWIGNLERSNSCCGWFNVFDYCTKEAMSHIMYSTLMTSSLQDFFLSVPHRQSRQVFGFNHFRTEKSTRVPNKRNGTRSRRC